MYNIRYSLAKYIVFPKIPKLDEKSRKQAMDTRATASRYLEETINIFTLKERHKERHARGKQIVENEMVPILNPLLVSCVTDTPQIPTISGIKDAIDEQTSNSFSSGILEFKETHLRSVLLGRKYSPSYASVK